MTRRKNIRRYDDPMRHPDHPRPKTRREFLSQGFVFGSGLVLGGATLSLAPAMHALRTFFWTLPLCRC